MKHCRPDNQNNSPYVSSYGSSSGRSSGSRSSNAGRRYRDEQPQNVRRQPDRGYSAPQNASRHQNAPRTQRAVSPQYNNGEQYTDISNYSAASGYPARQQTAKSKRKKKAGPVAIVLRVFFIVLLLFAGFMAVKTMMTYHKEDKAFEQLAAIVDDVPEAPVVGTSKYQQIYDMNHDFFGWIKIDDTDINYPVMYTPDDPEKYLHMDFYGNYSESGVLFIDGECQPEGKHYIIYGHHMFNGSMFGNLPKYENKEYYEDHKLIQFDTMTEEGTYEVFAALYSKDYDRNETGVFKYYNYKTLNTEIVFNDFVYNAKQESIYDTGITPQFGDEILTLSTCNYHTEDGRFVVIARKVKGNTAGAAN